MLHQASMSVSKLVGSRRYSCLDTYFCYQLIAKIGNKQLHLCDPTHVAFWSLIINTGVDSLFPELPPLVFPLTHWGRATHICVGKLIIIGSDNGLSPCLSPGWGQAIIWTNAGILLIGPLGTNFSEILIEIKENVFESVICEMAAILSRPQCVNTLRPQQNGQYFAHDILKFCSAFPWMAAIVFWYRFY